MPLPNILQFMRRQNIFGNPPDLGIYYTPPDFGGDITPPNPYENIQFAPPESDISPPSQYGGGIRNIMEQMYTPEHEASDRYNKLINQYPNRQDYKPGFWRSLGSMLVDYTKGPQAGHQMYEEPYTNKLMDWKNQITPIANAANLERQQNVNERGYAYQTAANVLREKAEQDRVAKNEAELRLKQWKTDHPEMKIIIPPGGNVYAINTTTGEKVDLGISSGKLTDQAKYDLLQKNAITRIQETGKQARETEEVREGNREDLQDKRAWELGSIEDPNNPGRQIAVKINKITGQIVPVTMEGKNIGPVAKPSTTAGKPETAQNKKVRIYNTAWELANSDPELGKYIHFDKTGTNTIDIDPPKDPNSWFGSGPTPEQHKRIIEAIYGPQMSLGHTPIKGTAPITNTAGGAPNTGKTYITPKGKVTAKPGYILVQRGDEYGQVKANELQAAINEGYSEVK